MPKIRSMPLFKRKLQSFKIHFFEGRHLKFSPAGHLGLTPAGHTRGTHPRDTNTAETCTIFFFFEFFDTIILHEVMTL